MTNIHVLINTSLMANPSYMKKLNSSLLTNLLTVIVLRND